MSILYRSYDRDGASPKNNIYILLCSCAPQPEFPRTLRDFRTFACILRSRMGLIFYFSPQRQSAQGKQQLFFGGPFSSLFVSTRECSTPEPCCGNPAAGGSEQPRCMWILDPLSGMRLDPVFLVSGGSAMTWLSPWLLPPTSQKLLHGRLAPAPNSVRTPPRSFIGTDY